MNPFIRSVFLLVLLALLCSCSNAKTTGSTTIGETERTTILEFSGAAPKNSTASDAVETGPNQGGVPEYVPGSIRLEPNFYDDFDDRKYRVAYHQIDGIYSDLVPQDEYYEWVNPLSTGKEPDEMMLVKFIKRFDISREEFDKATEELKEVYIKIAKKQNTDIYTESYEIPNADIIYTFDNEIINRYYRYE